MYLWRKFEDDLDLKGARNEGFVGLSQLKVWRTKEDEGGWAFDKPSFLLFFFIIIF